MYYSHCVCACMLVCVCVHVCVIRQNSIVCDTTECHYVCVHACVCVCVRVCDKTGCLHAAVSAKKGRKMPIYTAWYNRSHRKRKDTHYNINLKGISHYTHTTTYKSLGPVVTNTVEYICRDTISNRDSLFCVLSRSLKGMSPHYIKRTKFRNVLKFNT